MQNYPDDFSKQFDTQMVFLKAFLENINFDNNKKKSADDKKACRITQYAEELISSDRINVNKASIVLSR